MTKGTPPAITFVLRDAGETKGLLPVMRQLDADAVPYLVVTEGTASRLLSGHPGKIPVPDDILQLSGPARQKAEQQLQAALAAPISVCGMVSRFQAFWADQAKRAGHPVIGFEDSFFPGEASYVAAFNNNLRLVLTANVPMARWIRSILPQTSVLPLGQPVIEETRRRNEPARRAFLRQELGLSPSKANTPLVCWVGSYGKSYQSDFRRFCSWLKAHPGVHVLMTRHPSQTGQWEAEQLQAGGLASGRIVWQPPGWDGIDAVIASDAVVGHESTLMVQAQALNRPVFHMGQTPGTPALEPDVADLSLPMPDGTVGISHLLKLLVQESRIRS